MKNIIAAFVAVVINRASFFAVSGFNNATGEDKTDAFAAQLTELGYAVVEGAGVYKGTAERSLLVVPQFGTICEIDTGVIRQLAREYSQESILRVTVNDAGQRVGELIYIDHATANDIIGNEIVFDAEAKALDFHSDFAGIAFSIV